ncbi:hypothetical protein COLO4_33786 [Corchorus olitorius]|uniref:Uncharacterized protein n=1 Tax=Corchorus olitorius TaxID=93759 RepID=A0A1R3GRB2_9ROSI|nr:hypothetical protein COLO4_33786 [Corchorus olitorius]
MRVEGLGMKCGENGIGRDHGMCGFPSVGSCGDDTVVVVQFTERPER